MFKGIRNWFGDIFSRRSEKTMFSWAEQEIKLACEREMQDDPDDNWGGYSCACYKSALKAYKSLCKDGHSGFSIRIAEDILVRLIEGRPLTAIEDTPDIWRDITDTISHHGEVTIYQCLRMSSLFKHVYSDGHIKYNDVKYTYCVNTSNVYATYYNSFVNNIVEEMYPITLPYFPQKAMLVVCDDFLTDKKNGEWDTFAIFYIIKPDGERVEINRYFKDSGEDSDDDWIEISEHEYKERYALKI